MRIGLSSYSLDREIKDGKMTLLEAIDWAAAHGAECMELVPFAFRFDDKETGKIDYDFISAVPTNNYLGIFNIRILCCKVNQILKLRFRISTSDFLSRLELAP